MATMVIFRQNWSLVMTGYDDGPGVGTRGEGDKLQEVRRSESSSKLRGGRTWHSSRYRGDTTSDNL